MTYRETYRDAKSGFWASGLGPFYALVLILLLFIIFPAFMLRSFVSWCLGF